MLFPVFSFGLVLTCKTRRKRAISQHLESSFQPGTDCLEPLTWLLTWHCSRVLIFIILCFLFVYHICLGDSKGSENDTSKHVETIQLGTRRKKARGGHLERLKKETDQYLYLVPARHAEETSREECSLHNHPSRRSLRWRTREAATSAWRTNKELQHSQRAKPCSTIA